jgi:aspartate/methionine/tyrosine aminotransferase
MADDRPPYRISDRARRIVGDSKVAPYVVEHIARMAHPAPDDRYLSLAVAENHLMWDLIDEHANARRGVGPGAFSYADMRGAPPFREAVATMLGDHLFGVPVDPAALVMMSGAGTVIESLVWSLVDPGGAVVVPTPSYMGYWNDIESRAGVRAIPAHTRPEDDFRITPAVLSDAERATAGGVDALLLTNPSNPLGRTLTRAELVGAIEWARERSIPVIMNEIYGLSIHEGHTFTSAATVLGGFPDDVHFVWALSKDFAASGLRCGIAVTTNEPVHAAMMELLYFGAVSGDTQHLITTMVSDTPWLERYLTRLRQRLTASDHAARAVLHDHAIATIPGDAGIFLLADFRPFLADPTWEAESDLWRRILDRADVNLTPGSACRVSEPGFMRICHASATTDVVEEGLARVVAAISA